MPSNLDRALRRSKINGQEATNETLTCNYKSLTKSQCDYFYNTELGADSLLCHFFPVRPKANYWPFWASCPFVRVLCHKELLKMSSCSKFCDFTMMSLY